MPQKMKFRVEFVVADRENRGLPRNHSQKPSTRKIFTLQHDILTLNFPSPFNPHPQCTPAASAAKKKTPLSNYHLKDCHEAEPFFQQVPVLTLRTSLKSLSLRLWDEDAGKLVGYSALREQRS
jgi:hypothetical protein